jgi:sensor histidine kinase YesM
MKNLSVGELLVHLVIVGAFLFLLNYPGFDLTLGVFTAGDGSLLWPSITGTAINLLIFYAISFYLIPEVLRKRGLVVFIIQLLIFFSLLTFLEVVIDLYFYRGKVVSSEVLYEIVVIAAVFNMLFAVVAFAYRFSKDWFVHEKQRSTIREWQARTELETLKNQINPHFLFNALNSLFSLSLKSGDDKTAEGISKLSEMMRYVFDKSKLEKVALHEEIQYIEDYIYLQKLRFEDTVKVDVRFSNSCRNKYIAPMILIPFVENAFKHGVSSSEMSTIRCGLTCQEDGLDVIISNRILPNAETMPSTGVGLANVRKRLELIYPERHRLEIDRADDLFTVKLNIEL